MEITKRNRAEIKSYFVKNSIPTQNNFADLIDGMLNQKDDGLVKLPGDPLSIEAAGDNTSVKKLINFYGSFGDATPAWTLNLNPRTDPGNPGSARAGLNISDSGGTSRLFIDQNSGNIGLGTVEPQTTLDLRGTLSVSDALTLNNGLYVAAGNVGIGMPRPTAKLTIQTPNDYDGDTIRFEVKREPSLYFLNLKTVTTPSVVKWVVNQMNNGNNYDAVLAFDRGNVAIGTTESNGFKLHVAGKVKLGGDVNIDGHLKVKGYVAANQVYFSAYVDTNTQVDNLNPLPMQVVSQNVGDGFNTDASKFTAPVSGVYLFTMTGLRVEGSSDLFWNLMVNNTTYANQGGANSPEPSERCLLTWLGGSLGTASRTMLVALKQGDVVHVQQSGSGRCDNFRSGLEGVLLYETV